MTRRKFSTNLYSSNPPQDLSYEFGACNQLSYLHMLFFDIMMAQVALDLAYSENFYLRSKRFEMKSKGFFLHKLLGFFCKFRVKIPGLSDEK